MSLVKLVPTDRLKYLTKIREITIDDLTFRFHYRFTFSFLLIGSLLLSGEQFFGKPIQCVDIKDGTVPIKVIESYCWIEGTFTLPKGLMKVIGYEVAAPGIEQYKEILEEAKYEKDEVIEHSYYQWVALVLFIQALTFYVTHLLWKSWEKNKMANIINDLNKAILKREKKTLGKLNLVNFLYNSLGRNDKYAFHYFCCEILNLINVIIQMIFINWLLNGEFSSYGFDVLSFFDSDPSRRVDPMAKIFPKMTKCTFRRFGPSGDIVKTDHLCMLPLNILNEKMFVIFWFWLYLVMVLSSIAVMFRVLVIALPFVRYLLLAKFNRMAEPEDVKVILDQCSYGDWFLIYMLSKNLDPMHFRDVCKDLAHKIINPDEPMKIVNDNNYKKQQNVADSNV